MIVHIIIALLNCQAVKLTIAVIATDPPARRAGFTDKDTDMNL